MVGAGLDEWVADLPGSSSASVQVIRLAEGLDLLADGEDETPPAEAGGGHDDHAHDHSHDHASGNPHIWLDPILVRDQLLPRLTQALAEILPESGLGLEARAQELTAALTELDGEIRETLAPLEQRSFIVTHSAWSYFALQYGLDEAGVVHAHPGQDPSARELAHLLDVARDRGLECIFTEPQLGEAAVQAIATELSLPTCMLDPLGGPEEEGRRHYLELMRFNARQFAEGLGGGGP
jgi:zinc transport system substrate-binding protein